MFVVDAIQGRNGVGTYFQDLADHLRQHVAHVELVAPSFTSPHPCQGRSLIMPGDATQRVYFPRMRKLTKLAITLRPHVIVIPGPGLFALAGFWIASKLGIPICITQQTDYSKLVDLYWQGPLAPLAQRLLRWVNHLLHQGSTCTLTISQTLQNELRRQGVRNTHLVGTTLAPEFVNTPLSKTPKTPPKKIIFVGRLAPEKNLESFLCLAQQRPDIQFTIAGDGPLRGLVEQYQRRYKNIDFMGWCERTKVLKLIDQHDLLMLPSTVEAFGTVAIEAMVRQRMVMVSANCGITQWPSLAKGLFVIKANESLVSALKRIESLPEQKQQQILTLGEQAARALNESAINQWLDILTSSASQQRSLPKPTRSATFAVLKRLALQ